MPGRLNILNLTTIRRGLTAVMLLAAPLLTAVAQPYCTVRTFNLRDGLASNSVTGIIQTPDQLVWVSSWNGLNCYDGYHFMNFHDYTDSRRTLTTNRILNIQPSQTGNIWCVSYDLNPYLFDRKTCEYVDFGKMISERFGIVFHTNRALPMSDGTTWLLNTVAGGPFFRVKDDAYAEKDGITKFDRGLLSEKGEVLNWIVEDSTKRQWITTNRRVISSDGKYSSQRPYEYLQQVGDNVFFASTDGHVAIFTEKSGKFAELRMPAGVSEVNIVNQIDDHLFVASTDMGVFVYDTYTRRSRLIPLLPPSAATGPLKAMHADGNGRLWAATANDDIYLIDVEKGTATNITPTPLSTLKQTNHTFFYEDLLHNVWVATERGFSGYYDEKLQQLVGFPMRMSPLQPVVDEPYFDHQGNLWYKGDHDMVLVSFRYNYMRHTTGLEEVRSLMYDDQGRLWAGNLEGEIAAYDTDGQPLGYLGKDGRLHHEAQSFSTHIYSLYQDSQKRTWIGTKGDGLYCLEANGTVSHYLHSDADPMSLPSDQVYDVMEDHHHRIWVATFESGICLLSGKQFIHSGNLLKGYPVKDYNKARRLTETRDGVIVVSASNGLITFSENFAHPGAIRFYAQKYEHGDSTSIMTSDVMQAYVYNDTTVLVATVGGGVQRITDRNLLQEHLHFSQFWPLGAESGTVLNMTADKQTLWIGCENTINMFDPATGQIWRYGPSHLGEGTVLTEAESVVSPLNGEISIATNHGIISFMPDNMRQEDYVPQLVFDGVMLHGDNKMHMPLNGKLDVPANRRNLTIYFASLDYRDNYMIRYQYKLEGEDKAWNNIGTEHSITFNHLSHGHHRLLLRSTNSYGKWLDRTARLDIYVRPTFWETWWARLLYAALILGIVWLVVHLYKVHTRNTMERDLSQMKVNFFTDISHKLRTPLTLIGAPITEVLSTENLGPQARHHLEMVRRNADRMLALVNKMITINTDKITFVSDDNIPPQPADDEETEATADIEDEQEEKGKTRLLIVEDNDDMLDFLCSILGSDYTISKARDGQEGLEKARAEVPDFILTDVMMPRMDGLEMVRQIKADPNISHIPIVILSAKASMDDRMAGLHAGVNDYITKPFNATYLKQRMHNIISNQHLVQQRLLDNIKEYTLSQDEEPKGKHDEGMTLKLKATDIVDTDKQMMEQLVNYIEAHLDDPNLMIEDLANAVCLGRTTFFLKLKSLVGMSPVEFLRHIRIQHAEELVAKTTDSFSQIAYAVGFNDSRYFGKCFKKQTGMTPSEYRERRKAAEGKG